MNIEDRMSMWAAKRPREEPAELLLEGAQEIADLRRGHAEASTEVARLITVCECYAHSSAAACREIASLRQASAQDIVCPHVVGTTTQYCSLTPFTLTDEEREAVEVAIKSLLDDPYDGAPISPHAATLRSLLERMK
jgi:hypothetical protein